MRALAALLRCSALLAAPGRLAPRLGVAVPGAMRMRAVVRPVCALSRGPMPPHLIELQEDLESGEAQLFDVREPGEFATGALSQATLVPLSELQEGIPPRADKTRLTYIHCAAGVRVRYAKPLLECVWPRGPSRAQGSQAGGSGRQGCLVGWEGTGGAVIRPQLQAAVS
jgi:hypothetical protein